MKRTAFAWLLSSVVVLSACSNGSQPVTAAKTEAVPAKPKLGIRPNGDTELSPDMSLVKSDELKRRCSSTSTPTSTTTSRISRNGFSNQASRTLARAFPSRQKW